MIWWGIETLKISSQILNISKTSCSSSIVNLWSDLPWAEWNLTITWIMRAGLSAKFGKFLNFWANLYRWYISANFRKEPKNSQMVYAPEKGNFSKIMGIKCFRETDSEWVDVGCATRTARFTWPWYLSLVQAIHGTRESPNSDLSPVQYSSECGVEKMPDSKQAGNRWLFYTAPHTRS